MISKIFSDKWCWLVIIAGTLLLSWPMAQSGGKDIQGNLQVYGYWDQLMHVAFTHELMRQFPPQNPLFAGELLYNYNFGSDLVAAVISKIFSISPILVQFKILPVIYSLAMGFSAWWLSRVLGMSFIQQILFMFLTYFGSSFSFIADLFLKKNISWDDAFGLNQPVSYANNLPMLLSLALFMIFLSLIFSWEKHASLIRGVLIVLILGFSPLVKAVSIPAMTVAAVFSLGYFFLSGKRMLFWKLFLVMTAGTFFMVLTMGFFGNNSGGLVWYPLNPFERLIESPNFYDLTESWQLRWKIYKDAGNLQFLIIWYLISAGIFITGNLGSRLIGLCGLLFSRKQKIGDWKSLTIMAAVMTTFIIPTFFILSTGGFNVYYMFYYGLVLINISAAIGLSHLVVNKKRTGLVWLGIFLLLTLPGTIGTFWSQISGRPTTIDSQIVGDLEWLGNEIDSEEVILVHYSLIGELENYISALSGKRVYLEGVEYPRIQGHPVDDRLNKLRTWANMISGDITQEETREFFGDEKITTAIIPSNIILSVDSTWKIWRKNSKFQVIH